MPLIAFDYKGLSDKGNLVEGDEVAARVLVVRDRRGKCVHGHLVPQKGVDIDRFAVDCLVQDILWAGYTRVMLKSDNEKAILKLLS